MMKKVLISVFVFVALLTSCSDDPPTATNMTLDLTGLEALGNEFVYEGWIIVDGKPISTGTFSSITFPQTFLVDSENLNAAKSFVLSIEPFGETGDAAENPSETKILSGDFSGDIASVSSIGTVGDFEAPTVSGAYILATPTDGALSNELSGVWFLDNTSSPTVAGLNLPMLSSGWKYEGWVVIGDNTPLSTGTFTDPSKADENDFYSGLNTSEAPNFPGEDFLNNPPAGLTFPLDLPTAAPVPLKTVVVISVEPHPDNSPMPFTLKPLLHEIPSTATDHSLLTMEVGPVVSLTGSVTR